MIPAARAFRYGIAIGTTASAPSAIAPPSHAVALQRRSTGPHQSRAAAYAATPNSEK